MLRVRSLSYRLAEMGDMAFSSASRTMLSLHVSGSCTQAAPLGAGRGVPGAWPSLVHCHSGTPNQVPNACSWVARAEPADVTKMSLVQPPRFRACSSGYLQAVMSAHTRGAVGITGGTLGFFKEHARATVLPGLVPTGPPLRRATARAAPGV